MSPRTKYQYEEIREGKKNLIIETALRLFAEKGFHATSIREIAKLANISKGLMYNYFESKESLLKTIFESGVDELLKHFDRNQDGILTKEELEFWIDETMIIMLKNLNFWKLYFSLMMQPQVMKLVEQNFLKLFEPIMKILFEFFKQEGYKDPVLETRLLFAILDGVGMHYIIDPENFPMDAILGRIKEIYRIKK